MNAKTRRAEKSAPDAPARVPWAGALLLVLAVFAVYSPAARGSFIWDDDQYVNNRVYDKPDALRRIWIAPETAQYYPFAYSAFYLQKKLWGADPAGFHLVNILFHALNALLVWAVIRKLRIPGDWLAAAIFALHPVHVESVAWISELKNVLSGFFYLASLRCWLEFEDDGRKRWYWASLALFVPALLTKTVTCTLPGALLVLRWYREKPFDRDFLQRLALYLVPGAAAAAATVGFELGHAGESGSEILLSYPQRFIIAGRALWFYALKLAWPWRLVFNYERWQPIATDPRQWLWPVSALAAGAAAFAYRARIGRGPAAAYALFAGTLFPALGFFYIYPQRYSFVADHFQYLSTLAPAALVAALVAGSASRARKLLPALLLAAMAALSLRQALTYRDTETLWKSVILHNPKSFLAHNNLGLEYFAAGRVGPALDHYRLALKANPEFAETHNNLGLALLKLGRLDEAERHIRTALRLSPWMPNAYNNLGLLMAARGRPAEALRLYEKALAIRPGHALARYNIGNLHAARGDMAGAERQYRLALEEWPDYADARLNLANTMMERGDTSGAIVEYQRALRAKPVQPQARVNLGNALMSLGKRDEALEQYRLALNLDPGSVEALNNLANALAQAGRLEEAVPLYRRSLELHPGYAPARANLERALALLAKRPAAGR